MRLNTSYLDHDNKQGSLSLPVDSGILTASVTALLAALDAVTRGSRGDVHLVDDTLERTQAQTTPTDAEAQRTTKWLVSAIDANGNRFQFSIPTALLTGNLAAGSNVMDTGTGTDGEALVTAIEAYVVSPVDGSAVTVEKIVQVSKAGQ